MMEFLESVVREAGARLMSHLGVLPGVEKKGARDLVTVADRESEDLVIRRIRERFPNDAILAEESLSTKVHAERLWIVDPLDGTTNFVYGIPHFAVSIGLFVGGVPTAASVFNPCLNELYLAESGRGAFKNGRQIRVRQEPELSEALLCTGFGYRMEEKEDTNLVHFTELSLLTRGMRRLGAAALDLCYVAEGRYDGFWELHLCPWDVAAGGLVAREAGAEVTDFRGGESWHAGNEIVAANPRLADKIRNLLTSGNPGRHRGPRARS